MADNSNLMHSLWVYIQSLTTVSGSRHFGSVVEHWPFTPAARVQIPQQSWDFIQPSLLCSVINDDS